MSDEVITCMECGRSFIWSYGEQEYYKQRGLERPKRCAACRAQRRAAAQPGMAGESPPLPGIFGSPARQRVETRGAGGARRPQWMARPEFTFGAPALAAALVLAALIAFVYLNDHPVLSWLIGINVVTPLVYGYDKAIAGTGRTRAPENILLFLPLVGGPVGGLVGMWLFDHKTGERKASFRLKLWATLALWVVLVVGYYVLIKRVL